MESKSDFTWGHVIQDFEVGPYIIRKYSEHNTRETLYQPYINERNTNRIYHSLDEALAACIVKRTCGQNHDSIDQHFIAGVKAMANKNHFNPPTGEDT